MDYKNIEIHDRATETLKDMLKLKGDDMSLYTLKLIETQDEQLRLCGVGVTCCDKCKDTGVIWSKDRLSARTCGCK
jgi:hypothetical protein